MSWRNSYADCARELFKPSKDLASLQICNEKNFLVLDLRFLVSDIISGAVSGFFAPLYLALGPNR